MVLSSVIAGRVALALRHDVLSALAAGRSTVVVTGTNGKTTTTHLVAAALGGRGPIAHNASGSNMTDGAVNALLAAPTAKLAALEVDELHLGVVLDGARPAVVVVLMAELPAVLRAAQEYAREHHHGAR